MEELLAKKLPKEIKKSIDYAIKNNIPIIISGKAGVGKTTLTKILRENNITAYEDWECCKIELKTSIF